MQRQFTFGIKRQKSHPQTLIIVFIQNEFSSNGILARCLRSLLGMKVEKWNDKECWNASGEKVLGDYLFLLRILRVDWRGVWLGVSSSTKISIDNRRSKKFTEQRQFSNKTRTQVMTLLSHNSHCTHCNEINRQGGEKIFFRLIINQMWKRKSLRARNLSHLPWRSFMFLDM